jgi:hypothetical protein
MKKSHCVLALVAILLVTVVSRNIQPRFGFLGARWPWFVEEWTWDPRVPGPFATMYALDEDVVTVRQSVIRELGKLPKSESARSIEFEGETPGTSITLVSERVARTYFDLSKYPALPPGTSTIAVLWAEDPPAIDRLRAWIMARRWVGDVP